MAFDIKALHQSRLDYTASVMGQPAPANTEAQAQIKLGSALVNALSVNGKERSAYNSWEITKLLEDVIASVDPN